MLREAMEAADFLLSRFERRLDDAIGRPLRLALGRYASCTVIGVPLAWAINGFRFDRTAWIGLIFGLVLFACIDGVKMLVSSRRVRGGTPPS
jgi:ABC-type Fe3+ transport system permease subunit